MKPNPIYYVIGDIHGEIERLEQLHSDIQNYHQKRFQNRQRVIVHLGDYVDRGPDSYAVVEFIMALTANPPRKTRIINLKGNHELMMLKACEAPQSPKFRQWIRNGGREALESYEFHGFYSPTQSHLEWIKTLPSYFRDSENKLICVHAGVNVRTFPHDGEEFHLWTRAPEFFEAKDWDNPELKGMTIIHGHTPTDTFEPDISENRARINIDTGACYGGALTAAVLEKGCLMDFLYA